MVEINIVAKEDFEEEFESLKNKIANIETNKQAEVEKAIAEIEEKYAGKLAKYKELFAEVSETIEVEVPDEEQVDEVVEEAAVEEAVTVEE